MLPSFVLPVLDCEGGVLGFPLTFIFVLLFWFFSNFFYILLEFWG